MLGPKVRLYIAECKFFEQFKTILWALKICTSKKFLPVPFKPNEKWKKKQKQNCENFISMETILMMNSHHTKQAHVK